MPNPSQVQDYRALPYSREVELVVEEDGQVYFLARISEIPWVEADGETREEALLRLHEIFDDAIESMLESGDEVPVPDAWPASLGYSPPKEKPVEKVRRFVLPLRQRPSVEVQLPEDLPDFSIIEQREPQLA